MTEREKARLRAVLIQATGPACVGMSLVQIAESALCRVRTQEQVIGDYNKELTNLRWFTQWVADHSSDPMIVDEARKLGATE